MALETTEVFVCLNIDCKNRGAQAVFDRLSEQVAAADLGQVTVRPYLCFSACNNGPNVVIASKRSWFSGVELTDVGAIVAYLGGGDDVPGLKANNDPDLEEMIFAIIDAGLMPEVDS